MSLKYLTYTIHTTPDYKESTVEKLSFLYAEIYMIYDELNFRLTPYKNHHGVYKLMGNCDPSMLKYNNKCKNEFFDMLNESFAVFEKKRDYISAYEQEMDHTGKTEEEQKRYHSEVSQVINSYIKCLRDLESTYKLIQKQGFGDASITKYNYLKPENRTVNVEVFIFRTQKIMDEWVKELDNK